MADPPVRGTTIRGAAGLDCRAGIGSYKRSLCALDHAIGSDHECGVAHVNKFLRIAGAK